MVSQGAFGAKHNSVRYAVVGLGHIAQVAVLPAFRHARQNSRLVAMVSDDPVKRDELSRMYGVMNTYSYEDYDKCLRSGQVDAVFIALPNHLHCEYSVRAAEAGVHVLCEKPMAVTEDECHQMISAAKEHNTKLMVGYRLHFERANLQAVEVVQSGQLGEPRVFESTFCQQVREGDIRLKRETGGGTLYDIGIYCINAARYLFRADPTEVSAFSASGPGSRFREVDEMTACLLRFPGERLAMFTSSFGASDVASYRVVGTKGNLRVEPAYEYAGRLTHFLTINGNTVRKTYTARDQFSPELIYFSNCILENKEPEPSGLEGLADVAIIRALYQSARMGRPVQIEPIHKQTWPSIEQEITQPPVTPPELVHTESPSL